MASMPPTRRRASTAADDGIAVNENRTEDDLRPRELHYSAADGLKLFARDYGDPVSPWLPVVCLSGLARTGRDFHLLALHLAQHRHRPRRVIVFDYRGRGRSEWDPDPTGYNPLTELSDVLTGMAALGIGRAAIVGTSRGGIIGMLMALGHPAAVAGLVLNDVGPALEARGLARIKSYVGRTPTPDDWHDAAQILRRLHSGQFTEWNDADWDFFARLTYRDEAGSPVADYDPALANALAGIELDQPIPTMWDEFRALRDIPVLVVRGANSDLLAAETVARMAAEHPRLDTVTVAGEGHAPLFRRSSMLARISAFITAIEGGAPSPEAVIPRPNADFDLDAPRD
jgi:pimeloyl-ACP methyl ester carboxylesterase